MMFSIWKSFLDFTYNVSMSEIFFKIKIQIVLSTSDIWTLYHSFSSLMQLENEIFKEISQLWYCPLKWWTTFTCTKCFVKWSYMDVICIWSQFMLGKFPTLILKLENFQIGACGFIAYQIMHLFYFTYDMYLWFHNLIFFSLRFFKGNNVMLSFWTNNGT